MEKNMKAYQLYSGFSPAGGFVAEEAGIFDSLDAAQAAAEQEAGRPLQWRRLEERTARPWRAETGYELAAEIYEQTVIERIGVNAGLMT